MHSQHIPAVKEPWTQPLEDIFVGTTQPFVKTGTNTTHIFSSPKEGA